MAEGLAGPPKPAARAAFFGIWAVTCRASYSLLPADVTPDTGFKDATHGMGFTDVPYRMGFTDTTHGTFFTDATSGTGFTDATHGKGLTTVGWVKRGMP